MIESAQGILTLEEVASYLRVTNRTMYRLTQEGAVSAFKLGGTWQFWRDELNQGTLSMGKPFPRISNGCDLQLEGCVGVSNLRNTSHPTQPSPMAALA